MKKLKKLSVLPMLVVSMLLFVAWTPIAEPDRYADVQLLSPYANETVSYTYKVDDLQSTAGGCPEYMAVDGLENACGAVAGTEIVAFYDKYYTNLIPGWDSYYPATGKYRLPNVTYTNPIMHSLYTSMRTNVDDVGVSESDCLSGLKSYINDKGYSVNYQSVLSGSTVNFEACKTATKNNKVIILFSRATNIYSISENGTYDTIVPMNLGGLHIMVGFGYYEAHYYNASGLFRTDYYLQVSTGLGSARPIAMYKVNPNDLNAAYIVNIA